MKAPLPETQVAACPRQKISKFPPNFIKQTHIEHLEHNQKLPSCCRHPENHEVEARKSKPSEVAPNIYIFYCDVCGDQHRFFCIGLYDIRPVWEVR